MSFSAILSEIKRKPSSSPEPITHIQGSSTQRASSASRTVRPPSTTNRAHKFSSPPKMDPAVARLKELRRLEKEKAAAEKAKNAPPPKPRQSTRAMASANTIRRKQVEQATRHPQSRSHSAPAAPVKKLTYAELLQQAKEKTKLLKETSQGPELTPAVDKKPTGYQSKSLILRRPEPKRRPTSTLKANSVIRTSSYAPKPRPSSQPKPIAKPSAKLQAKLAAKKKSKAEYQAQMLSKRGRSVHDHVEDEEDEEEYDSDGFIVDDEGEYDEEEEVEADTGYRQGAIWKLMRGDREKSSRFYDDDDDLSDMEATGYDVEREERLAAKRAKQEDLEEEERERKRREEKKRRLGRA